MDSSDEKGCEGVTHVCDPNVKFGCKDSGEEGATWVGGGRLENTTVTWCLVEGRTRESQSLYGGPWDPKPWPELSTSAFCGFLPS